MKPVSTPPHRRKSPREPLNAPTALHTREGEFLCRTRNISESGLCFVLREGTIRADEVLEADVLLGSVLRKFRGVIVYFRPTARGAVRVGLRFAESRLPREEEKSSSALAAKPSESSWGADEAGSGIDDSATQRGQRSQERRKVRLQVRIESGRHAGVFEDISARGAFLWSPILLSPGQPLRVAIISPRGEQQLEATVRWTRRPRGDDALSTRTGMGIAFAEPLKNLEQILAAQDRPFG